MAALFLGTAVVSAEPALDSRVQAKAGETAAGQKAWKVRQQAWKGVFEPGKGRAVRVQLFRGKEYRFAFGTESTVGVHILGLMDGANRVVAKTEPGEAGTIAAMEFSPVATGTYLVLLRTDGITSKQPGAMVYSYR